MPARYELISQKMSTLLDISTAGTHDDDHYPVGYRAWIDPNLSARWAAVHCHCGSAMRTFWKPETETYKQLLIETWQSMTSCSKAAVETAVETVVEKSKEVVEAVVDKLQSAA